MLCLGYLKQGIICALVIGVAGGPDRLCPTVADEPAARTAAPKSKFLRNEPKSPNRSDGYAEGRVAFGRWRIDVGPQTGPRPTGRIWPAAEADARRKIVDDVVEAAQWMSEMLPLWGYRGDFSLDSLRDVDRLVDDNMVAGRAKPGGSLAQHYGDLVFGLGSYVGEVLRRQGGGQWHGDDNDPDVAINVSLRLADGTLCWPIQRVLKRIHNGAENGIHVYGLAILGKLTPNPQGDPPGRSIGPNPTRVTPSPL